MRRAQAESARLRDENARLRAELHSLHQKTTGLPTPSAPVPLRLPLGAPAEQVVTKRSPLADQIALFRRLCRGREDVYATRWEQPEGNRAGYSPAARSRWHRERGQDLPLTDEVVGRHLAGDEVLGIYPLQRDETCWFLAADSTKKAGARTWQPPGSVPHPGHTGRHRALPIGKWRPRVDLL